MRIVFNPATLRRQRLFMQTEEGEQARRVAMARARERVARTRNRKIKKVALYGGGAVVLAGGIYAVIKILKSRED